MSGGNFGQDLEQALNEENEEKEVMAMVTWC